MLRILYLDADRDWQSRLTSALQTIGHEPVVTAVDQAGLDAVDIGAIDLVAVPVDGDRLPTVLISRLRSSGCEVPLLLVRRDEVVGADTDLDLPGVELVSGPLDPGCLRAAVDRALEAGGLKTRDTDPVDAAASRLVGQSAAVEEVLRMARAVANSSSSVLVEGESGTGKELVVRMLHDSGPRAHRPFVAINCAALPEGLIESTLFGHERGAFTGAAGRFIGAFERAHGGTLLLDEISELRLDLQAKLLRAIQERQFERVGGSQSIRVDVRIMATTNRNLEEEVQAGRFRADLYYRLGVVRLRMPSLRERPEDIPRLVRHFVTRFAGQMEKPEPRIPAAVLSDLTAYNWPGNVRELEHAAERAVLLVSGSRLRTEDFLLDGYGLPPHGARAAAPRAGVRTGADPSAVHRRSAGPVAPDTLDLKTLEKQAILRALDATGGHRTRAAHLLGISDRTLRAKLKAWRIGVSALWRDLPSGAEDHAEPEIVAGMPRRDTGSRSGELGLVRAGNSLSNRLAA